MEAGYIDDDELCLSILEMDKHAPGENAALLVWGDSSNPRAWEASVPFFRRWGWLVQDCRDLLESTNYWRAKRGEKELVFSFASSKMERYDPSDVVESSTKHETSGINP